MNIVIDYDNAEDEVLARALKMATANGFKLKDWKWLYGIEEGVAARPTDKLALILSRDFAKALWGKFGPLVQVYQTTPYGDELATSTYWLEPWQYHLQQMVIAKDPIKYLGEHI